jgi:hypothetical protein
MTARTSPSARVPNCPLRYAHERKGVVRKGRSYLPRPTVRRSAACLSASCCKLKRRDKQAVLAASEPVTTQLMERLTRPASSFPFPSVSLQCSVTTDSPAIEQPVHRLPVGALTASRLVVGEATNGTRQG